MTRLTNSEQELYRQAYWLSLFTIFYNIIEGIVSMVLGYADAIGAAGLTYFSISGGKEAFEKAKGKECNCRENCKIN